MFKEQLMLLVFRDKTVMLMREETEVTAVPEVVEVEEVLVIPIHPLPLPVMEGRALLVVGEEVMILLDQVLVDQEEMELVPLDNQTVQTMVEQVELRFSEMLLVEEELLTPMMGVQEVEQVQDSDLVLVVEEEHEMVLIVLI